MSVGEISGSGMNALYYSAEQNQAYIMEQNQLVPVPPEETQEILEEHDIKIKNGKAYSISEDYELSPADVAAALSAGGIPELPPTMQITGASKPESVGKAINRLADSSGISGLLFQQLMTLMKSARDDQELNEQLTLILQSGKIANMRGDLGALAAKQSAEKSAEQTSFVLQCIAQGAAAAASLLGAAGDNTKVQVAANMASTTLSTLPAIYKKISYESGDYAKKGEEELRRMDFQKAEEISQQTIDSVRSGSEGAKEAFKSAVKLIQDVAQRQNDNIKAMNV